MSAACPKCQSKLPLEDSRFNEDGTISCPSCQVTLKVIINVELVNGFEKSFEPDDGVGMPSNGPPDGLKKILLCIDGEGTRDLIKELLVESQFSVVDVASGKEALSSIRRHRPAITLIDTGLSDIVGTELCSEIKSDPDLGQTAVMLVASMYDKSSKRREPDSLLGADDYIDRRMIQNGLLMKLENLLRRDATVEDEETPTTAGVQEEWASTPVEEEVKLGSSDAVEEKFNLGASDTVEEEIDLGESDAVEEEVNFGVSEQDSPVEAPGPVPHEGSDLAEAPEAESEEVKDAKRLARIIVSDIALYNPKKVDEGIQNDTFFDLLEDEIEEGKQHYLTRVSESLSQPSTYLDEAFKDYIDKRKSSLS